jgi:hypothetical protein
MYNPDNSCAFIGRIEVFKDRLDAIKKSLTSIFGKNCIELAIE